VVAVRGRRRRERGDGNTCGCRSCFDEKEAVKEEGGGKVDR